MYNAIRNTTLPVLIPKFAYQFRFRNLFGTELVELKKCVYVCVCARGRARARAHLRVRAGALARACVFLCV